MTIPDIKQRALDVSRSFFLQPEAAQSAELQLYRAVLAAIADLGGEAGAMAEAALEARPRAKKQGLHDGSLQTEANVRRNDRRRKARHEGEE